MKERKGTLREMDKVRQRARQLARFTYPSKNLFPVGHTMADKFDTGESESARKGENGEARPDPVRFSAVSPVSSLALLILFVFLSRLLVGVDEGRSV